MMIARSRALFVALVLALGVGHVAAQPWIPEGAVGEATPDLATRLGQVEAELAAVTQRFEEASADEARANTEIHALEARAEDAERHMKDRVRALYRIRHMGALPLAGGFDALLSHLGRLERLERVVRTDVHAVHYLGERRAALRSEAARAHEAALVAEEEKRALEQQKAALDAEAASYAYAAAAYLPSLSVTTTANPTGGYGTFRVASAPPVAPVGFAALRGRLGRPVTGPSTVRDAIRDDGPGVEFLSPAGTPVYCLADGRVAFARTYGSYGRVVIVEHGDGYYTVYGGLGRIDARVGDAITRGAPLGTVGAASEPALFFEVRKDTRSLDARSFLGL
jgi:septal ring factor EnvC (AmiA/AmiB activator)